MRQAKEMGAVMGKHLVEMTEEELGQVECIQCGERNLLSELCRDAYKSNEALCINCCTDPEHGELVITVEFDCGWSLVGCDECHAINGQCGDCDNGGWWHCDQYAEFAGHGRVMCLKCESVKEWRKYD